MVAARQMNVEEIRRRFALLRPEQFAEPIDPEPPACPTCGGLGVVKPEVPVGHPLYGRFIPCPDANCPIVRANWEARYAKISTEAQIPKEYRRITFAKWHTLAQQFPYGSGTDPDYDYMAGKWGAYAAAVLFVESVDRGYRFGLDEAAQRFGLPLPPFEAPKRRGFILSGTNGVGKTSLAVSVANHLLETCRPVVYVRLDDFWAALRERYQNKETYEYAGDAEDEAEVMRLYQRAPVLILDEFTPDKLTEWKLNTVHQLIDYRYTNAMPTLITTNTRYEDFRDLWGGTTGDRLLAMSHWIEMGGLNLRPVAEKWVSP